MVKLSVAIDFDFFLQLSSKKPANEFTGVYKFVYIPFNFGSY